MNKEPRMPGPKDPSMRARSSADELFRLAGIGWQDRARFFLQMDELLLDVALNGKKGPSLNLDQDTAAVWDTYFEDVPWTKELANQVHRYRRAVCDWVWPLYIRGRPDSVQFRQMQDMLALHRSIAAGMLGRSDLAIARPSEERRCLLSAALGTDIGFSENYRLQLSASPMDDRLNEVLSKWSAEPLLDAPRLSPQSVPTQQESLPSRKVAESAVPGEPQSARAQQESLPSTKVEESAVPGEPQSARAQQVSLPSTKVEENAAPGEPQREPEEMKKGLETADVEKAPADTDTAKTVKRNVKESLMWMALVYCQMESGEGWNEQYHRNVLELWPQVMAESDGDGESADVDEAEARRWAEHYLWYLRHHNITMLTPLLHKYSDIHEMPIRLNARLCFTICYVLARGVEPDETMSSIATRCCELLTQTFPDTADMDARTLSTTMFKRLRTLCGEAPGAASAWLAERFDVVEDCFDWLRDTDRDTVHIEQQKILVEKSEASEDLLSRSRAIERAAYAKMLGHLCDPGRDGVLYRMYDLAQGRGEAPAPEDTRRLMRNFFALLNQLSIRPVRGQNEESPGWSVDDVVVVEPDTRKEK